MPVHTQGLFGGMPPALAAMFAQLAAADTTKFAQSAAKAGIEPPVPVEAAFPGPGGPSVSPVPPPRPALTPNAAGPIQESIRNVPPAQTGVNPLEALVPPTVNPQQQAPGAIAPRPGGQINPAIMQLIMQALQGAGAPQQQQSLGSILGQTR